MPCSHMWLRELPQQGPRRRGAHQPSPTPPLPLPLPGQESLIVTSGALMLGEAVGLAPCPGPRAWCMAARTMAGVRLPQVHHTGWPVSTWAWGSAHAHPSGRRGAGSHISILLGGVTAGCSDPHLTASPPGWGRQPGPTGPPCLWKQAPRSMRAQAHDQEGPQATRGVWGPLPVSSRLWVPAAGPCHLWSLLGCPLSPSCSRTAGAV